MPKVKSSFSARPSNKRQKVKKPPIAHDSAPQSAPITPLPVHTPAARPLNIAPTTTPVSAELPDPTSQSVLQTSLSHLTLKYNVATISILSSSKISQRVRALLLHLEKFSFADRTAKPGIAMLHAKASAASKLVSVVEIAKREVEMQGGKWWQYCSVHGKVEEMREKKGKNLCGEEKVPDRHDEIATETHFEKGEDGTGQGGQEEEVEEEGKEGGVDRKMEDEEEEEAFETMAPKEVKTNPAGSPRLEERKKVRAIPIMTIYMSRVPVPELKQLYGEQTNA